MSTWRARLTRDPDGTLTTTAPEVAPEWVTDLLGDLTYRFRDSPDARTVTVVIDGSDTPPEETPLAAPGAADPTTAAAPPGAVLSAGPGPAPPDAWQPDDQP